MKEKKEPRKLRNHSITVRASREEIELFREVMEVKGWALASWMRGLAINEANRIKHDEAWRFEKK